MKGLKISEISGWSPDELRKKISEAQKSLFQAKIQHGRHQLESPMTIRKAKIDIAKMKTILRAKERGEGSHGR